MSDHLALRTEGLGKRYGGTWALHDCTLEVPSGSVTALVGPNGAGKTTLLHLAIGPALLLLDEPVASLGPLARREFLNAVMEVVTEDGVTVLLSSHIVAELERVCDHLITLTEGHPQLAGPIDEIVASHRLLTGP